MRKLPAILIGKSILKITRILKNEGSAAPGLYALKIDPRLIEKLSQQIPTNIVITGTNGKTTTARLLDHFAKASGLKIIRNSTGSNLERGIASALIENYTLHPKPYTLDLGIWEVDEAAFNTAVFKLRPKVIVFLNAFRDQLDRYGEVDTVIKKWQETLHKIDWDPLIILNGDDPSLQSLSKIKLNKSFFGVKNQDLMWEKVKSKVLKKLEFEGIIKEPKMDHTLIDLKYLGKNVQVNIPLPGTYNTHNFLAAFAISYYLNFDINKALKSLKNFSPAFGRFEKIKLGKKNVYISLIKNPAGATAVLETIAPQLKGNDRILLALNDNFADGTDVSWIWDTEFELLSSSLRGPMKSDRGNLDKIIVSGTRAHDLTLRLKYANIDPKDIIVEPDLQKAFHASQEDLKGMLYVLPTYTAMLQLQRILADSGVKKNYWEEDN